MFYIYALGVEKKMQNKKKKTSKKYEIKITNLICHDFMTQYSWVKLKLAIYIYI